ncbi:hypothetical protein, partial [[Eubacterium] cellulosolvens]
DRLRDNEEAIVSFRSNTKIYDNNYVWLALDYDDDGALDGFGRDEEYIDTPTGSDLLGTTPDGDNIYKVDSDPDRIYIDYTASSKPVYSMTDPDKYEAILDVNPTHQYQFFEKWE